MTRDCAAPEHGTVFAYLRRRCRCPEARVAMRPIWASYRRRRAKSPKHWHNHQDVDEAAVYRAVRGERMPLGAAERRLAVAALDGQLSAAEIAARIGCSARTVVRHRSRLRQDQSTTNRSEKAA